MPAGASSAQVLLQTLGAKCDFQIFFECAPFSSEGDVAYEAPRFEFRGVRRIVWTLRRLPTSSVNPA
jgi:hypothetical protein